VIYQVKVRLSGGKKEKRKKAANGGLIVDEDLTMMVDV